MKTKRSVLLKIFAIILLIFISINYTHAQNDSLFVGREYTITLLNRFEMTGIVTSITPDTVKIKTDIKTFNVPRKDIATVLDLNKEEPETFDDSTRVIFDPDPNESRLFLCPTGKTLKAGHGYISTALLYPWVVVMAFPFANFGITDFLNLGVGTNINAGLFVETHLGLMYIAPKVRAIHTDNVNVSFGLAHTMQFSDITSAKENQYGILYGVSSFDIKNITLSCGTGITYGLDWGNNGKLTIAPYPLFMFGFEHQTIENTKFISENWISFYNNSGYISVFSFGVRQMTGNFAFDVSVIGIVTNTRVNIDPGGSSGHKSTIFIPCLWGSIAYNFEL